MKIIYRVGILLIACALSSCESLTREEIELRASQKRAEEERTVQAIRRSPFQPGRTKGVDSTETLNKQN